MESVLIVSGSNRMAAQLGQLLGAVGQFSTVQADSGGQAGRLFDERCFDLVVIDTPLPDEFGDELAARLQENAAVHVMLLTAEELEAEMEEQLRGYGIFVLPKPLSRELFEKAFYLMRSVEDRLRGIRRENIRLRKKIEEIRIINRAKYTLMKYLSMSEEQAHRYLEKQAMDLRLSKVEVAKNLLSTYDG